MSGIQILETEKRFIYSFNHGWPKGSVICWQSLVRVGYIDGRTKKDYNQERNKECGVHHHLSSKKNDQGLESILRVSERLFTLDLAFSF
jgi:hypothetical protein